MTTAKAEKKALTDAQLMRYSRHIMMPSIDIDGQEALWNSNILIIGMGGLGCAAAQYLAASGVGKLTLVDDDEVEHSNLQRQVLHVEQSVGLSKTESAKLTLATINSEVSIHCINKRLNDTELEKAIKAHTLVLDCTDNLTSRNQINRLCHQTNVPLVSGAAIRMEGQVATFTMQHNHPCYHCLSHLFGEQTLTCSEAGILSPVVGLVGCIQATEAIKFITQIGDTLSGKILVIDAATMQFNQFAITKHPACNVCS
ncbi:molybdopterin-synthase adenylyltransferase MoeB [Flocculibacter collagenilyticus]|uniref:molybdopterin-synthase adenylyltransferase MoeB n=1 Tax=Flocculibacter collagenilyticus TaxID=2744479 RepID=UPI0018F2F4A5|nr:molybdopterin-synthase adenylyltransferase MoeB [Flocculibacter collagenilyticus]